MAFGRNLMGSFGGGTTRKSRQQLPAGFGAMVNMPISGGVMTAFSQSVAMPTAGDRKTLVDTSNTAASDTFTANQSSGSTDPVMNKGMTFLSALDAKLGERMANARRAREEAAKGATMNTRVYRRT